MTSQFGGAKNPPWVRSQSDFLSNPSPQMSQNQMTPTQQLGNTLMMPGNLGNPGSVYGLNTPNPPLGAAQYNTTMTALQQQTSLPPPQAVLPQPGIVTPTTLASHQVNTVSYPTPKLSVPSPLVKQRVFTGTVTKLHDTFGFVDEEVFFQMTSVKGNQPKVGERVLVEASYNSNMPFKWNATRIQLLPGQHMSGMNIQPSVKSSLPRNQNLSSSTPNKTSSMSMNAVPPPSFNTTPHSSDYRGGNMSSVSHRGMQNQTSHRTEPSRFSSIKGDKHGDRDRERRERERNIRRKRSPIRSRSPRSPPRKRSSKARYVVQIPKLSLNTKNANVVMLKSRYCNMYIPSDFFFTNLSWTTGFPLDRSFKLGNSCNFHVYHKDVEPLTPLKGPLEPSDADHLFSAKVMLLSSPPVDELYHKSCGLAEDSADVQENFQHPTRLLQFLVGIRGKNEPMAIGGPWSPSLDGDDPVGNPQVLINTAIRTTKALTGINLKPCTKWYRFAEICYMRPAGSNKGRHFEARVETVVIFIPDVWMCSPSHTEWEDTKSAYAKQLENKIGVPDGKETGTQDDEEMDTETNVEKKEPTHYTELDAKSMKIVDLRQELEARSISAKGLKSQLIARLTKSLKSEQEAEEEELKQEQEKEKEQQADPEAMKQLAKEEALKKEQEEEQKKKDKKDKALLQKKYEMPDNASILVHPHPTAKQGKFDCSVMSLSVLLDYRPEDNKEHSFEVSLFAEMFNEMLMRDFGFQIYLGLCKAPAKKEEKEEKKEEKNKDDKKEADKEADEGEKDKEKSQNKEEDMEQDEGEKDEEEKKEIVEEKKEKKIITSDPGLLLSFVYYDQNHTGYLIDKDIEDIFMTIGLQLSRAQIKKVIQRVLVKDSINYRTLTDTLEDETVENALSKDDLVKLSKGNHDMLEANQKSLKKDGEKTSEDNSSTIPANIDSSVIMFKGSMINIDSLLDRLEKSEDNRMAMDKKLLTLENELDHVKGNLKDTEQSKQKISSELQKVKEEMGKVKVNRATAESQNKKYNNTMFGTKDLLNKALASINRCLEEEQQARNEANKIESNKSESPISDSCKSENSNNKIEVNIKSEIKTEVTAESTTSE